MSFRRGPKFAAKWTEDSRGNKHPSASEARWFDRLFLREKAGEISALELNPTYEIRIAPDCPHCAEHGVKVCDVELDARYIENGAVVIADFKGIEGNTPVSKLKRKLAETRHRIVVTLFGPAAAVERKKSELKAFKRAERENAKAERKAAKRPAKTAGDGGCPGV